MRIATILASLRSGRLLRAALVVTAIAVVGVVLLAAVAYFARSPVDVKDSKSEFAVKLVSKRIASELLLGWSYISANDVPMGTPLDPVEPFRPATLDELPDLASFFEQTTSRDLALARELADWLRSQTVFGASVLDYRVLGAADTLNYAQDGQPFLCGDIVRLYIMLAQALELDLRMIYLWSPPGEANHVVAEVWSNDFGKWAIVDVQENIILTLEDGIPLSAREVTDLIYAGKGTTIDLVTNGENSFYSNYEEDRYKRKYTSVGVLLRADFQRMSQLSSIHPANLESQTVAVYNPSGSLMPRLYYGQGIDAERMALAPK